VSGEEVRDEALSAFLSDMSGVPLSTINTHDAPVHCQHLIAPIFLEFSETNEKWR
jgi:hypothetical protein